MSTHIPNVIHQIWIQGERAVPRRYRAQIRSWQRHNPTWQHHLWDGESIERLIADGYPELLEVYNTWDPPTPKSDVGRYALLDAFGGVYADIDSVCVRPLDEYLQRPGISLYVMIYDNPACPADTTDFEGFISNALIAVTPGHDIWRVVFDRMMAGASSEVPWIGITGPAMYAPAVMEHHARRPDDVGLLFRNHVVGAFYMSKRSLREYGVRNQEVFAVHFNDSARRRQRIARRLRMSP